MWLALPALPVALTLPPRLAARAPVRLAGVPGPRMCAGQLDEDCFWADTREQIMNKTVQMEWLLDELKTREDALFSVLVDKDEEVRLLRGEMGRGTLPAGSLSQKANGVEKAGPSSSKQQVEDLLLRLMKVEAESEENLQRALAFYAERLRIKKGDAKSATSELEKVVAASKEQEAMIQSLVQKVADLELEGEVQLQKAIAFYIQRLRLKQEEAALASSALENSLEAGEKLEAMIRSLVQRIADLEAEGDVKPQGSMTAYVDRRQVTQKEAELASVTLQKSLELGQIQEEIILNLEQRVDELMLEGETNLQNSITFYVDRLRTKQKETEWALRALQNAIELGEEQEAMINGLVQRMVNLESEGEAQLQKVIGSYVEQLRAKQHEIEMTASNLQKALQSGEDKEVKIQSLEKRVMDLERSGEAQLQKAIKTYVERLEKEKQVAEKASRTLEKANELGTEQELLIFDLGERVRELETEDKFRLQNVTKLYEERLRQKDQALIAAEEAAAMSVRQVGKLQSLLAESKSNSAKELEKMRTYFSEQLRASNEAAASSQAALAKVEASAVAAKLETEKAFKAAKNAKDELVAALALVQSLEDELRSRGQKASIEISKGLDTLREGLKNAEPAEFSSADQNDVERLEQLAVAAEAKAAGAASAAARAMNDKQLRSVALDAANEATKAREMVKARQRANGQTIDQASWSQRMNMVPGGTWYPS